MARLWAWIERPLRAASLISWGVVLCASPACGGTAPTSSGPGVVGTTPVRPLALSLDRALLVPGTRWVTLPANDASSSPRRFVIMVPDVLESAGPRPLVVFLHGAGGGGRLLERLTCLLGPAFAELQPIVVAPEAAGGQWWLEDETSFVLGLTQAAARDWPVRADRVVIMGYSNGGIGTWFFARLYPEPFSAAIPMASNDTIVGDSPLPIFAIHGSQDELFDVTRVSESIERLAQRGLDVRLEVRAGARHGDACSFVPELTQAANWLEHDVWSSAPPTP